MSDAASFVVEIDNRRCEGKAACLRVCPTRVFRLDKAPKGLPLLARLKVAAHGGKQAIVFDPEACIGCMQCVEACPEDAIMVRPAG
jgi:NAD-dependent dihydropyrimidine dehydrogenase PreA subunit